MSRLYLSFLTIALIAAVVGAAAAAGDTPRFKPYDLPRQPALLIFPGYWNLDYLADHAPEWSARGVSGVLFGQFMVIHTSEVWASDGHPESRGEEDANLQAFRRVNEICRAHGIDRNFLKVAFSSTPPLPDWFDDGAWQGMGSRFHEGARFARLAGAKGMALDIEYVTRQYDLDWRYYRERDQSEARLRRQTFRRGRELAGAMLEAFPAMDLLIAPESVHNMGALAGEIVAGMVEALADRQAPGQVGILAEGSYHQTDPLTLTVWPNHLHADMAEILTEAGWRHWRAHGTVALGNWPIGPDPRAADQVAYFPIDRFKRQYAATLGACPRYHWLYADTPWWSYTPEEMVKYQGGPADTGRLMPDFDSYMAVVREKALLDDPLFAAPARLLNEDQFADVAAPLGFITRWRILGPFDNPRGAAWNEVLPPERELDVAKQYEGAAYTAKLAWLDYRPVHPAAILDLAWLSGCRDRSCWYLWTKLKCDDRRQVQIRLGTDDPAKLWIGGKILWQHSRDRNLALDQDIVPAELPAGETDLLLKLCRGLRGGLFCVRITDGEGRPLPQLAKQP